LCAVCFTGERLDADSRLGPMITLFASRLPVRPSKMMPKLLSGGPAIGNVILIAADDTVVAVDSDP
jgi:hypothetical protein